jgi:hypothetical protein
MRSTAIIGSELEVLQLQSCCVQCLQGIFNLPSARKYLLVSANSPGTKCVEEIPACISLEYSGYFVLYFIIVVPKFRFRGRIGKHGIMTLQSNDVQDRSDVALTHG